MNLQMDDRRMETRTVDDSQSGWTGDKANEYRSTVPFSDTIVLGSLFEEAQVENIDDDTKALDVLGSVKDMATQMVDDYEEEVVLDSDDERVHKAEIVRFKELTFDESKRAVGGGVLDTNKDFVVGRVSSPHKQCHVVYKRRVNSIRVRTVHGSGLARGDMPGKISGIGPNSIHSDACYQKQLLIIKNDETFRPEDQFSVDLKNETKRRDVLSNISSRNMLDRNELPRTKCEAPVSEKDNTLVTSELETVEVRQSESQEPGESSQANALGFVDHYLSFNRMNLCEEVAPTKTSRPRSPPVLCAKGPQILARRASLGTTFGMPGTFEWDANQNDDGDGNLLKRRRDLILNGEGPEPTSVTRGLGNRNLNVQSQRNLGIQGEEKFQGEMMDADLSNSSLIVLNTEQVGDVLQESEMKFAREMDDQLNAEAPEQQLEADGFGRDVPDTFDVGFDTQMAAEAMEALFYAPPPNSDIHYAPQDPENMIEDSSKGSMGKCLSKVISISGVTARKLKQTNKPPKKLSAKVSSSYKKNKKSRKELDPELPDANKVNEVSVLKRRRENGQNRFREKCPKIGLHISEEAKDVKVGQQAQQELDVAPAGSHLKFDIWSYPRGKRTHRNVPCRSKGLPSTLAKREKGNKYSIESHKKSQGNSERIEVEILSNGNAKTSLAKFPSPVDLTKGLDRSPAILNGKENGKQYFNKKLSRSPLLKELISLGVSGSLPNNTSREFRRRRDMANVRVLFSQNLDDDIVKQQNKILARLGSSVASCCSDATHFIADRFVRTRNMLESIALGKPVVTNLWLDSCGQACCFIDEKNYILRDAKKEKEFGFSMPVSLAHARQQPLLKGRRVFVTPNINPGKELIVSLVKAVQGQALDRIQDAEVKNEMIPDDILILSCEQDYALCKPFLDKGAAVYSSELLLNGIIIQKLEFERHRLFKNHLEE